MKTEPFWGLLCVTYPFCVGAVCAGVCVISWLCVVCVPNCSKWVSVRYKFALEKSCLLEFVENTSSDLGFSLKYSG